MKNNSIKTILLLSGILAFLFIQTGCDVIDCWLSTDKKLIDRITLVNRDGIDFAIMWKNTKNCYSYVEMVPQVEQYYLSKRKIVAISRDSLILIVNAPETDIISNHEEIDVLVSKPLNYNSLDSILTEYNLEKDDINTLY
jgi:hypothetical protein